MKILSMTATFGKLDNQTLTLQPELNVIHAPNEWGKSTWCAFITAMLYGIETSQRTSSKGLADKERYAPWSGKPMSGRMDIDWDGRKITLERSTKGRTPFGQFRAYETESGLPVAELTAQNCGMILLGVEKQVFLKSAFIRQSELPVTQDEALRRRLNALVTTGDESGASDALAQKLKDLKNKCRHNKTGKLPEAEAQREALNFKLRQLREMESRCYQIQQRQTQLQRDLQALENHRDALAYAANRTYAEKLAAAQAAQAVARERVREQQALCENLPSRETLSANLAKAAALREEKEAATTAAQLVTPPIGAPEVPNPFRGLDPQAALQQAKADFDAYNAAAKGGSSLGLILGIVTALVGIGALCAMKWITVIPGILLLAVGAVVAILAFVKQNGRKQAAQVLAARYTPLAPESWVAAAQANVAAQAAYQTAQQEHLAKLQQLNARMENVNRQITELTGNTSLNAFEQIQKDALEKLAHWNDAQRELARADSLVQGLAGAQKEVAPPRFPDELTLTPEQTQLQHGRTAAELQDLQRQLGLCQGQMATLGQEALLTQELDAVNRRIEKLEQTYAALTLAQETLAQAAGELQRRFAPRLSAKARELFGRLTGGRYDRLVLGADLNLSVAALGEDTLHDTQWPSDGTVDQLYLALRLAVAGELTPEAPLILDDAFVRFDDDRAKTALELLREEAAQKQVILFSCQKREMEYM